VRIALITTISVWLWLSVAYVLAPHTHALQERADHAGRAAAFVGNAVGAGWMVRSATRA